MLTTLKESEVPVALVHDEYGHFEGIVTPADILEAITGVFRSDLDEEDEPPAVQREDGSWLLAGYMQADEMAEQLGIDLPENRDYETVAGYVLSHLHHLPATGECVDAQGWRFEVVDLDGRRIDKVIASRLPGVHRAGQKVNVSSWNEKGGLRHPMASLRRSFGSCPTASYAAACSACTSAARASSAPSPTRRARRARSSRAWFRCSNSSSFLPCCRTWMKSPQTMCTACWLGAICSSTACRRSCSTARAPPTPP